MNNIVKLTEKLIKQIVIILTICLLLCYLYSSVRTYFLSIALIFIAAKLIVYYIDVLNEL